MKMSRITCILIFVLLGLIPLAQGADHIWLEWTGSPEPDLHHYLIYRSLTPQAMPNVPTDLIASTQATNYVDNDVTSGQTYYYWVASSDQLGNLSTFSGPLAVTFEGENSPSSNGGKSIAFLIEHVDADQDLDDPFVDRTADNDETIEFVWSPIDTDSLFYRVYVATNSGPEVLKAVVTSCGYQISQAEPGSEYRLRVDALTYDQIVKARGYSDVIRREPVESDPEQPGAPFVEGLE